MKSSQIKQFTARLVASWAFASVSAIAAQKSPNIVFIFADDMGYGDVQILNPKRGKILTPHMNALAREGMIFTDAHTSSSVCTPSRYSLMTGRYNWRTTKQAGVNNGFSKPLIPTDRETVASLLKKQGYNTSMIGKWHIGMNMPKGKGKAKTDWKGGIKGGSVDLGFDYYFGISASAVGKWHLGFGAGPTDWNKPLRPGPQDVGFDYYWSVPNVNIGYHDVIGENSRRKK